jgi:hypothetical protein
VFLLLNWTIEVEVLFVMQLLYPCSAFMTECNTLPRLHEQPPGALSGAGQNGTGSVAAGQLTK